MRLSLYVPKPSPSLTFAGSQDEGEESHEEEVGRRRRHASFTSSLSLSLSQRFAKSFEILINGVFIQLPSRQLALSCLPLSLSLLGVNLHL